MAAVDRSSQMLEAYTKDGTLVATGAVGTQSVAITGLAAGTVVATGDYQVAYTDGVNTSAKTDVPGWTVEATNQNQGS